MQLRTVWQFGSSNPDNANHFATISQWWSGLQGKEITWRQRLMTPSGQVDDLNWEAQRFDENFVLNNPEIRGITLYWSKPDNTQERNITAQKLELDNLRQQLYIYPQSQKDVVIRVAVPEVVYQKLEMNNPQCQVVTSGDRAVILVKDEKQGLEVRIALGSEMLNQLKQQLSS